MRWCGRWAREGSGTAVRAEATGALRWLPRLAVDAVLDALEERRWRIEV